MGVLGADSRRTLIHPASQSSGLKMTFWQENYHFIKDVYLMRHQKMAEWMENVEKAIARIMADKVYTSAEFKRERDNFHALCKDLERSEVKKWLAQILEILMAERAASQREEEGEKLTLLIKKHEELIPLVMKTQVMVDLYWKCYAYGDELKPHIEFLDGIMLSSTRDIAPSCVESVDELIERQEKSLVQLETKRGIVKDLIEKGKVILQNPDKPKFLESHVQRIEIGWDDTKAKAQSRLQLLTETKDAWVGYAENSETIVVEYDKAEEEIKKVKKRFQLDAANEDLKKRQGIFKHTKDTIDGLESALNANFACMCITVPDDKKKLVDKELKVLFERLNLVSQFKEKVERITKYVTDLQKKVLEECDKYSEDVKFWAEYKTGIKEFSPWLGASEAATNEGLTKPTNLDETKALHTKVHSFDKACLDHLKLLEAANAASQKMT